MRFNLFDLIKQLEVKTRRSYTLVELAEGMSISRPTLNKLLSPAGSSGTTVATILSILDFFEAQEMPITINELVTIERVQNDHPNPSP